MFESVVDMNVRQYETIRARFSCTKCNREFENVLSFESFSIEHIYEYYHNNPYHHITLRIQCTHCGNEMEINF